MFKLEILTFFGQEMTVNKVYVKYYSFSNKFWVSLDKLSSKKLRNIIRLSQLFKRKEALSNKTNNKEQFLNRIVNLNKNGVKPRVKNIQYLHNLIPNKISQILINLPTIKHPQALY